MYLEKLDWIVESGGGLFQLLLVFATFITIVANAMCLLWKLRLFFFQFTCRIPNKSILSGGIFEDFDFEIMIKYIIPLWN